MKPRRLLQGAGVAALVLFLFYRSLIDAPGELRMHMPVSTTTLDLARVTDLVMTSLVFWVFAIMLSRSSKLAWLKLFVPALVLASLIEMIHIARSGWESSSLWAITLLVILFLTVALHLFWPRGEKLLLQLSGSVLIGLGFFCIFVVVQLLRSAMWHQSPNSTRERIATTTIATHRPRIVWILFDELSYRQTFGNRYANLQLPNFDALRDSSTLFTDTEPIINETEKAIPSILLGQKIMRVDYTAGNQLWVGNATGALYPFDAAQTPFALAHARGLTTGVVGWYNPYCGILEPYLNECYWTDESLVSSISTQKLFMRDSLSPWLIFGMIFDHPIQIMSPRYRAAVIERLMVPDSLGYINGRVSIYPELMRRASRIVEPSGPDFVFLHLPLPHPPGFYNRITGEFDTSGHRSYIDNLALTDKTLGELLAILKHSPRWKDTSVIVCGDHSWRLDTWRGLHWTAEDEAATRGRTFDPRPVLMVHMAGQTTEEKVTTPFPLLHVHDILDDLIEGRQPAYVSSLQNAESSSRE
jgi:Sulfatase